MTVTIRCGFADEHRDDVAKLFWDAFSGKLGGVLGPDAKALAFLAQVLQPEFALVAFDSNENVLGVAGFKTCAGGLFGGDFTDLRHHYGWLGGAWRAWVLNLFERPLKNNQLLMDGIFVSKTARGQGVGTQLLQAIVAHAKVTGATSVRLDVVDNNPRARKLYERFGFVAVRQDHFPFLRPWIGISASTEMRYDLGA